MTEPTDPPALFACDRRRADRSTDKDTISQYLMYAQTAENVSGRRIATLQLMSAASAALLATLGFGLSGDAFFMYGIVTSVVGILIACLALSLVDSHRMLNSIKYAVILEFEQTISARPFTREWGLLRRRGYVQLTLIERWIPVAFAVMHVLVLVYSIVGISSIANLPTP